MPRRCPCCGTAGAACGATTTDIPVDVIERTHTPMGKLTKYDVSGLPQGGKDTDTIPFPADTFLKLDHADAVRMGLEKPKRNRDDNTEEAATADAKPRRSAGTRKRPAPKTK